MTQKVALVTGAMGGLGTAMCHALAKDGFKVYANCLPGFPQAGEWLAAQKALGFDFSAAEGDVADFDSCKAMVEKIEAEAGGVDVLVNNAGITRDKFFMKMDKGQWDAVISTNLTLGNFMDTYSERVFSRVSSNYTMIKLIGKDIRIQKKILGGN